MEPILVATMRDILLKAWGTYFTEVSNSIHEYSDPQEIEQEYDEFMEDLEKYFPKDKKNVFEAAGYMASNEQLKMIDELAGEVLKVISFGMQLLPEPVKKVLENRVVQGLAKTSGGLTQIAAGCELCTTVVGSVQGIPMIALGTNMAFEGLQDLWYTLNGELDKESKNLIKEATGHKIDNIVELSEIGMSIYAGKVSSKKIAGKIGEESEKLGGLLKKIKKPASLATRTKRLVKKFLPKRHYRKFEVVDIEELAKKQGLKPNLQLFAENKIISTLGKEIDITPSKNHFSVDKNPGTYGKPNTTVDILDSNGNIKTRRWFDSNGRAYRDVDMTNHGNPKKHIEVPHEHIWKYENGKWTR